MKVNLIYLLLCILLITCKPNQEPKMDRSIKADAKDKKHSEKYVIDATKEAEYVVDSYINGIYAIKAAELVEQKSTNKEIKEVANKIANTHKKIINELNELASFKKISLPSDLNQFQRSELNKLNGNDLKNMDKVFIQQMKNEHKEDIELFEKISKESEDNEISTLAITNLSSLKLQYDEVVAVKERIEL